MSIRPLHVWHILGPLRPSGMERMLVAAAPHWPSELRHTVVGQGSSHPYRDALERTGYRTVTVPSLRSVRGARSLAEILQTEVPDVVHVHSEGAFLVSVSAAHRVPRIVRTVHSMFPVRGRESLSRRAQALLVDRRVGQFVAPSPDVAVNERALGRECRVIYNWVSDEFARAGAREGRGVHALIVGNASSIKNHDIALRAVAAAGVPLAYVGDESGASFSEVALLDLIESRGLLLHRGTGNPAQWFSDAGVFLMPSRREGMGVALAEALAMGVPSLILNSPGLAWATDLPGVNVLPADVAAWTRAIPAAIALGRDPSRVHPDFSAARGAREYTDVYAGEGRWS